MPVLTKCQVAKLLKKKKKLILPKKQSKQRAKRTNEMEKMSNQRLFAEREGSKNNRTPNPALTILTRG